MDILSTIDYNIRNFSELFAKKKVYESEITRREKEVEQYSERIKFLKGVKTLYLNAVDLMYQESIGVLQDTLNSAMQYVMTDKDYSIKLELEDKRGSKTLNLALRDNAKGFEVDLKDSVGGGVRTIISLILKLYLLSCENSSVLFLDEKMSALSSQYVPYLFEFIHRICEERNFILVLITHDSRFMDYGDRTYLVSDGVIRQINVEE